MSHPDRGNMSLTLPTLYSRDAQGKLIQWTVGADGDVVWYQHGRVGGQNAISRTRCYPTNEGRSNARTAPEQAAFEATAAWNKKVKMGYQETIEAAETAVILLPMLAHPYIARRPRKAGIFEEPRELTFPLDVQLKYNGLRGLVHKTAQSVDIISRGNDLWPGLTRIKKALDTFMEEGELADGEVYRHLTPLQRINSWVKVECPETDTLWFQLYDLPTQGTASWAERLANLQDYYTAWVHKELQAAGHSAASWGHQTLKGNILACVQDVLSPTPAASPLATFLSTLPLQLSPCWTANGVEDLAPLHQQALVNGYEGLILRQRDYPYALGKRSEALIKWKNFEDGEFKILEGRSIEYFDTKQNTSYEILDVFVVQNDMTSDTFEVKPRGTIEDKKEMWESLESHIGEYLLVRFPERSEDFIPQGNPVGILRLAEDIDLEDTSGDDMWD